MNKFLIVVSFFLVSLCGVTAQNISVAFVSMPDSMFLQMNQSLRQQAVQSYFNGDTASITNLLGEEMRVVAGNEKYLKVQTSESGYLELRLLNMINNTELICMVTTVKAPVESSIIRFYDATWHPLDSSFLFNEDKSDWFFKKNINQETNAFKEATQGLAFKLIRYELSLYSDDLKAYFTTPLMLSKEEQEKLDPFLNKELKVYHWEQTSYR